MEIMDKFPKTRTMLRIYDAAYQYFTDVVLGKDNALVGECFNNLYNLESKVREAFEIEAEFDGKCDMEISHIRKEIL
jgi:hypothetical protein